MKLSHKGLSQNSSLLQGGIGELQMDKGQVIADLLFPADKEAPRAVRPGVTSFDYPAAGALSGATSWLDFALLRDVWNITEASGESLCGPTAVAFVQTEMLPTPSGRLGTREGNRLQRGTQQLDVVSVGAGDRDAQRHTATIRHDRSLDAELTAIGRVFSGFFPRPTAPWSWLRRVLASAIRSRVACHTFADMFSRSDEIPDVDSIPESTGVPCWARRTVAAMPSTGSPYATDRRFRWRRPADLLGAAPPSDCADTWATTAPTVATFSPASAQTDRTNCIAYPPP
jgi:hypothetical protein